jgi:hypothetical protein
VMWFAVFDQQIKDHTRVRRTPMGTAHRRRARLRSQQMARFHPFSPFAPIFTF